MMAFIVENRDSSLPGLTQVRGAASHSNLSPPPKTRVIQTSDSKNSNKSTIQTPITKSILFFFLISISEKHGSFSVTTNSKKSQSLHNVSVFSKDLYQYSKVYHYYVSHLQQEESREKRINYLKYLPLCDTTSMEGNTGKRMTSLFL